MTQTAIRPRKRLFTALLLLACALIPGGAALLWWLPSVGLANIHPILPYLLGGVVALLALTLLTGLALLILSLHTGRDLFVSQPLRQVVIRYLFPASIAFGRLLGIDRDTLQQSFIAFNNQLVRAKGLRLPAARVLLLLPHCLQATACEIKITAAVDRCSGCCRCDITPLAALARERGIDIAVASGGTLARKIIVERRPSLIVAVACERDLTSGIRDAYPLPVLGVLNQRPCGPCCDTCVDPAEIEQILDDLLLPAAGLISASAELIMDRNGALCGARCVSTQSTATMRTRR